MKCLLLPIAILGTSALLPRAHSFIPDSCTERCKATKDPGRPTTWITSDPAWAATTVSAVWNFSSGACVLVGTACNPDRDCSSSVTITIVGSGGNVWNLHPDGWSTNCTNYPYWPELWCKRPYDPIQGGQIWFFTKSTPCGGSVNSTFDFLSGPGGSSIVVASVVVTGGCSSCLPPPL